MSNRVLPDIATLRAHRQDGLTDKQIGELYGVNRSNVSRHFRAVSEGSGRGVRNMLLPPVAEWHDDYVNQGGKAIAQRYGVSLSAVVNSVWRARQHGDLAAWQPKPKPERKPRAERKPKPKRTTLPLSALDNTPRVVTAVRPKPKPKPKPAPIQPDYTEPDLTGLCAAREIFGSRVCDKHPHPRSVAHEGAGPKDARGEFWGSR